MTDLTSGPRPWPARAARNWEMTGAETVLVPLVGLLALACVAIAAATGQAVAWAGFAAGAAPAIGLFLVGLYIRAQKSAPRLARLATANAIYLGFTATTTLLIYLRFPVSGPLLDTQLMAMDAALGYSWPDFVAAIADWPLAARALRYVYVSSLAQLFLLVGYLALSGRDKALDGVLLTGSISLVMTTLVWWIAPSVGPSAFHSIPAETERAMMLVTDAAYGAELRHLVENGLPVITASDIVGTIAFPSYHTVMALLVVWFLRGTPVFLPALLLNSAMVPAILSHGGHHLVDMAGGIAVFAAATWLAARIGRARRDR